MSRSKYKAPPQPPLTKNAGARQIDLRGIDDSKKPLLRTDGTLYVQNIETASGDGLNYTTDKKNTTVLFNRNLDSNTQVQFIPKYVDKVYNTTVSFTDEVKAAFGTYRNEVKKFVTEEMLRYKTANKVLRKEIDNLTKNKNQFFFTETKGMSQWAQIYIDSTQFGPYNYDCIKCEDGYTLYK